MLCFTNWTGFLLVTQKSFHVLSQTIRKDLNKNCCPIDHEEITAINLHFLKWKYIRDDRVY